MSSKILVTGGAGAIGCNLVNLLQKHNHQVIVIDDLSSGNKEFLRENDIVFINDSILDKDLLNEIFSKYSISAVFHLAAFFANQNSVEHPDNDLSVNGLGTLNLLETSLKYKVQKFIYSSSSCVYGTKTNMHENIALPINDLDTPYAITKLLGEQYCNFFAKHHKLNTLCIRIFNSYGPYEKPGKYRNVIPNFIQKAINKEPLIITGDGTETRDFTFVGDVIAGIYNLYLSNTTSGDIFNIGSGKKTKILDLANKINEITNNNSPIIFKPRRSWDCITDRLADISKVKKVTSYAPNISLEEGLKQTYNWFVTSFY